jgi:hypothetical protein
MRLWKQLWLSLHDSVPVGGVLVGSIWIAPEGDLRYVSFCQGADFAGDVAADLERQKQREEEYAREHAAEPAAEDATERIRFREFL